MKTCDDVFPFSPSPVSVKLVGLIERNADELTRAYLEDVKTHADLPTYRSFNEREVYLRAHRVFSQLGKWISAEVTEKDMMAYWTSLGRQRRGEGFALSEIMLSLCLIRRRIWRKIANEGLLDTALDLYQALELQSRVANFFERAIFHAIRGFEGKD